MDGGLAPRAKIAQVAPFNRVQVGFPLVDEGIVSPSRRAVQRPRSSLRGWTHAGCYLIGGAACGWWRHLYFPFSAAGLCEISWMCAYAGDRFARLIL
jgi:hypothetical protein